MTPGGAATKYFMKLYCISTNCNYVYIVIYVIGNLTMLDSWGVRYLRILKLIEGYVSNLYAEEVNENS